MIEVFNFSKIPPLNSFFEQNTSSMIIYDSSGSDINQLPSEYNIYLNGIIEKDLPSYLFLFSFEKSLFTLDDLKNNLKEIVNFIKLGASFKELSDNNTNTILCHFKNKFLGIIKIKDYNNFYKNVIYLSPENFRNEEISEKEENINSSNKLREDLLKKIKEVFKC